jgi:hypothetical protein
MKTSNIILVTFFLLIFLTPFLMSLALKNKINRGEYSKLTNIQQERRRKIITGEFNVLEIKAPSNELFCTISLDDSSYIDYDKFYNDSIGFRRSGDTLSVFYLVPDTANDRRLEYFHINIHIRNTSFIKVEKATARLMNSANKSGTLKVSLTDSASFSLNNKQHWGEADRRYQARFQPEAENMNAGEVMNFDNLEISAQSSKVFLSDNMFVKTLTINADNKSSIQIFDSFKSGSISGRISDSTHVTGPWSMLRNLKQ